MLRIFGVLLLFTSAASSEVCADDECSFIQQGLSVASEQSVFSEEMASSMVAVKQALYAIPLQDEGRQLVLKTLLSNIQPYQPGLNANTTDTFKRIRDLLMDIIGFENSESSDDNITLSTLVSQANACNIQQETYKTEQETNKDTVYTDHKTCRNQQSDAHDTFTSSCSGVIEIFHSYYTHHTTLIIDAQYICRDEPDTGVPTIDEVRRSSIESWTSWATDFKTYATDKAKALDDNDLEKNCHQAIEDLDAKKESCDIAQVYAETVHCGVISAVQGVCADRASCHATIAQQWTDQQPAIVDADNARWILISTVFHIICMIDDILRGDPVRYNVCNATPVNESLYKRIDEWALPALASCSANHLFPYPGYPGWTVQSAYGDLDDPSLVTGPKYTQCNETMD